MNLNDAVELAGGDILVADVPPCLPLDTFESARGSLEFLEGISGPLHEGLTSRPTHIRVVQSSSIVCSTRRLSDESHLVVVPLGLIVRLRLLAGLMLRHWQQQHIYLYAEHAVGRTKKKCPPLLVSLFDHYRNDESYWPLASDLEARIPDIAYLESDIKELIHLALVNVVGHELGHVVRKHANARRLFRAGCGDTARVAMFERMLEYDADVVSASWSIFTLELQLQVANQVDRLPLASLRMGYALTLLYALYDATVRNYEAYAESRYMHPLVRRHLFVEVTHANLREGNIEWWRVYAPNELRGWVEAALALNDLAFECGAGKWGDVGTDPRDYIPLSALHYNTSEVAVHQSHFDAEFARYSTFLDDYEKIMGEEPRLRFNWPPV